MINVLILEKDLNYSKKIINKLSKINDNIRFCSVVTSLPEFYNYIKEKNFDILFINLEMLNLIEPDFFNKYNSSIILICSKKNITKNLLKNSVIHYYITKQDSIDSINKIVTEIINKKKNNNIKELISKELNYLGYNPTHKGYQYLLETVYILNYLDDYYDDNLAKDIYPIVADKFGTTPLNVKYDIRNATESMYYYCKRQKLQRYLGIEVLGKPGIKNIIFSIEKNIQKKLK